MTFCLCIIPHWVILIWPETKRPNMTIWNCICKICDEPNISNVATPELNTTVGRKLAATLNVMELQTRLDYTHVPFYLFLIKHFSCFPSQQCFSPFRILTALIMRQQAVAPLPRCPSTIIAILHSSFPMEQWEKLHTGSMLLIAPLAVEMRH